MRQISTIINFAILFALFSCATLPHAVLPVTEPMQVITSTTEVANSASTGESLKGIKYTVPFQIARYLVDQKTMQMCIIVNEPKKPVSGPVTLIMYDLVKNEIMWSRKTYAMEAYFHDDLLLIQGFKSSWKTFALDRKTGDVKWQKDASYFYPTNDGIAFTGLLTAFDLTTGQDLWSRKIKNDFGWIEHKVTGNDMIVAMDGLHRFDLKTGEGWDAEMVTGKLDHAKAVGANILSGIAGGGYVPPEKISGLASNIYKLDDKVYFTASDDLNCLDYNTGKVLWHIQLKERKTGATYLFSNAGKLILINKGSSYRQGIFQKYGQPYIAVFDIITGEQLAWKELDVSSPVKDFRYVKDVGFSLTTETDIMFFDFNGEMKCKSGTEPGNKKEKIDKNLFFVRGKSYFTQSPDDKNKFQSLISLAADSNNIVLRTSSGFSFYDNMCTMEKSFTNFQVKQKFYSTDFYALLDDDLGYIPNQKNRVDYSVTTITSDGVLKGWYNLPSFARNNCRLVSEGTSTPFLFYISDMNSFVLCPLTSPGSK
ncbi:MAG: PQQ-binding-like beta-propeller repeat protein [Bacteroidales bacterium]